MAQGCEMTSHPCFYNTRKGGVWMEQILKAVVIGVLSVVIAALNESDSD